jgi:hypothetical protein
LTSMQLVSPENMQFRARIITGVLSSHISYRRILAKSFHI